MPNLWQYEVLQLCCELVLILDRSVGPQDRRPIFPMAIGQSGHRTDGDRAIGLIDDRSNGDRSIRP